MKNLLKISLITILSTQAFSSEFITIGTGSVTGTYYPTGGAICRLVNQYKKDSKIRCSVESTDGSLYNLNSINNKDIDFGIVQSDILYQTQKEEKSTKSDYFKLKSVMAIYPELLTLVTRKDANINTLIDLKDKRINLGNSGSGNESTALTLFNEINIEKSDLKLAGTFSASEMPDALKENKIDGYFYMVGHPTTNIKDAANSISVKIVSIENTILDSLIKKYPYYAKGTIPADTYKGQKEEIITFGVKAVLVTNENVSEKVVYSLVKAILENFDEFKKLHPAYSNITKESLLEGLSAPLHDGAKRYYKEIGLIK
jgi:TRAP transporter TAXI family solute receptor